MDNRTFNEELFSFLGSAPTSYHAVSTLEQALARYQFATLNEGAAWNIEAGKRYLCTRNGSLIAFTIGSDTDLSEQVSG